MADLSVELFGLHFPNPVLAGAGPLTGDAAGLLAALEGGAGGLVTRTILSPESGLGGQEHDAAQDSAGYGRDGILHNLAPSRRPLAWLQEDLPAVAAAARTHGVPLIASLAADPAEVRALAQPLVAAGAQALEVATCHADWPTAVAALQALRQLVTVPIIAKLSLTHGEEIAERAAAIEPFVDGFTCIAPFGPVLDIDVETGGHPRIAGPLGFGYLSGAPVHPIAVRSVFAVARRVSKPVIASGGAITPADVVEFLQVGASVVQVTTAALTRGPKLYGHLAGGLGDWLGRHGMPSVGAVHGTYLAKYGHGQRVVTDREEVPQLNADGCAKCTICGDVCFYDAMTAPKRQLPVLDEAACFQCGLCVSACPTAALSFRSRDLVTMLPQA